MNPKVLIIGGFGWRDIGDEAMPEAVIQMLREERPEVEIVMLSPNPTETSTYHKVRAVEDLTGHIGKIPRFLTLVCELPLGSLRKPISVMVGQSVLLLRWLYFWMAAHLWRRRISIPLSHACQQILREIEAADLLFNVGGGNINSVLPGELYKQTAMHMAASALGRPVILSGQTLGPFRSGIDSLVTSVALNRAALITMRDREVSRRRAVEIGVGALRLVDTADDAVTLRQAALMECEQIIRKEPGGIEWLRRKAGLVVAINLNGYLVGMQKSSVRGFEPEICLASEVASRLAETFQAKVLLVATDYGKTSDDRPLLQQVRQRMRGSTTALLLTGEYNAAQLKGFIAMCDFALGSRYHFAVFALSSGVPGVFFANGVYQRTKLQGVAEAYGVPELYFNEDSEVLSVEALWSRLQALVARSAELRARLQARQAELAQMVRLPIREASRLLRCRQAGLLKS
jgi:polysaccharide pyruvyl transferase WcaK-like protein